MSESEQPPSETCPKCGKDVEAGIANLGTEWLWFCLDCPALLKTEPRT